MFKYFIQISPSSLIITQQANMLRS